MIQFLSNTEIDRQSWDRCIDSSPQGLIYAKSWYLDLVSPGWCALAEEGYSSVMPLPLKRKYGIPYIMQPLYCQQLGIFSEGSLTEAQVQSWIESIPASFRYIALNLNSDNPAPALRSSNNYLLSLEREYAMTESSYSANTRRNIQKAAGLSIRFDGPAEDLIRLKAGNTAKSRKRVSPELLTAFVETATSNGSGFLCTAYEGDKPVAAAFFLHYRDRIIYLVPVSNSAGRDRKAMFGIIDLIIQKFSASRLILDFEGSNIPGLARFFEGFGAENRPYPVLRVNRLPFPLNKFSKF